MNIKEFEDLSKIFFESTDQKERLMVDKELKAILKEPNSLLQIYRFLFDNKKYRVKYLCLLLLRDLVAKFWMQLEEEIQSELLNGLLNNISFIVNSKYRELFTPASLVFSRMYKFGFLTNSKIRNSELLLIIKNEFFKSQSSYDNLVGIYLFTNLVTECNMQIKPFESLTHHRLFLTWFRDKQLFSIFSLAVKYLRLSTMGLGLVSRSQTDLIIEMKKNEKQFYEKNKDYFKNNSDNIIDQNLPLKVFDSSLELILSILNFNFYFATAPQDLDSTNNYRIRIPIKWCRKFKFKVTQMLPSLVKQFLQMSKKYRNVNRTRNGNDDYYEDLNSMSFETTRISKILKCITLLCTTHYSLFIGNNQLMKQFLRYLLGSILLISSNHKQIFHTGKMKIDFSQLNQKLIINWKLSQLESCDYFDKWATSLFEFAIETLEINDLSQINSNVIYYLASFWSTLASKMKSNSQDNKKSSNMDKIIIHDKIIKLLSIISKTLIQIKIEQFSNLNGIGNGNFEESIEDLFLPKSSFLLEIKILQDLVRFEYLETKNYIVEQLHNSSRILENNTNNEEAIKKISIIVMIIGTLISRFQKEINFMKKQENQKNKKKMISFLFEENNFKINIDINDDVSDNDGDDYLVNMGMLEKNKVGNRNEGENVVGKEEYFLCGKLDIELICKVIELIKWNEDIWIQNNQNERCVILELSILYFLQNFLKVYYTSFFKKPNLFYKYLIEFVPDFKSEQDIFLFIFIKIIENLKSALIQKEVLYQNLKIFKKLINSNIWPDSFFNLDPILKILSNHNENDFPFLKSLSFGSLDKKIRILFYQCLTKLLIAEKMELIFLEKFEDFITPFDIIFVEIKNILTNINDKNNNLIKNNNNFIKNNNNIHINNNNIHIKTQNDDDDDETIEQILSFLLFFKGFFIEMSTSKYLNYLYDWLFPEKFEILNLIFSRYCQNSIITNNILQLWMCFVKDNNQLNLLDSLNNGYENRSNLFMRCKFCLQNLNTFLNDYFLKIEFTKNNGLEINDYNYIKTIKYCYVLLRKIILSLRKNLGIFEYYQDETLNQAINNILLLSAKYSLENLLIFPKLSKKYYFLLLTLTKEKISFIINLNPEMFDLVFSTIKIGLNSKIKYKFKKNCQILEMMLKFYSKNYNNKFLKDEKKKDLAMKFHNTLIKYQDDLISIMSDFFQLIVYENEVNTYLISQPLLILIFLFQHEYLEIQKSFIRVVNNKEKGIQIQNLFDQLMKPIENNLNSKNKIYFANNLNVFRNKIRETGFLF
ncbi:exportin [Anaeramoeba flamelloides]|uniref:Exportin n=1 Tax=Anaeramoeba flamelloides TaxID=1746091 RepID=A0AAV7ZA10_9EUKA|nr:exportin [Anaeramoeba flamelloides]